MVDGEYFKKLEAVARSVKGNDRPFGGIQLIFTGDFLQVVDTSKFGYHDLKIDQFMPKFILTGGIQYYLAIWDQIAGLCFILVVLFAVAACGEEWERPKVCI